MLIPMAQVFRLYIQMFLRYGLYVCITLETAHHRTTFVIFCNITQKTTLDENSHKMFDISSLIALFSYGKVRHVFGGITISFPLGRTKGRVREGYGGEGQNEFFLQNFHYQVRYKLYLTNCW